MSQIKAVILAAGKGTRMQSEACQLPKVLRRACGKPLLAHVLEQLDFLPPEDVILVVGYLHEAVEAAFPDHPTALQEPQLGTGHAVASARALLEPFSGTVLVGYGDVPLLRREVYQELLRRHAAAGAACTLLVGAETEDPTGYGRVITDGENHLVAIVEERDCTPAQRAIRDINVGIYAFDCAALLSGLGRLENRNAQQEYYLTDVPALIQAAGGTVQVYRTALHEQILGVNTPAQLAEVEQFLRQREEEKK